MKTKIFGTFLVSMLLTGVALAAPTNQIIGGVTSVQLSPEVIEALNSLNITPSAITPGQLGPQSRASFPIPAGAIDLGSSKGDLFHSGGLAFDSANANVSLLNFIISTTGQSPVLNGLAVVNDDVSDRIPLFKLNLNEELQQSDFGTITINNVDLTLTQNAAEALNSAFGTTAFQENLLFGSAVVVAQSFETSTTEADTGNGSPTAEDGTDGASPTTEDETDSAIQPE